MRPIDSWIDRFARKHPRFGVPRLINIILAGNVLVYLLDMVSNGSFSALLWLDFGSILNLELWRLVTFIFVPDSSRPLWFIVGLFFYYFLGNTMEQEWGTAKFNLFYLSGAVLTFLASIVSYFWGGAVISVPVTLSAVHSTLFLAFATLYPEAQLRLYFIIPVKAKWLAVFYVFMEVWNIVGMNRVFVTLFLPFLLPATVASWVNYLIFFWTPAKELVSRAFGRAKHQASPAAVNFRAAQKKAKETRGYLHKCAVCGKTDTDFPDMEFRYCSKCDGYYCYCEEHINNHVHVHQEEK